jgi:SAM-dependent methyltransferase
LYYKNKLDRLRELFGNNNVVIDEGSLRVGSTSYPIVDDVIILLEPTQYPDSVKERLGLNDKSEVVSQTEFFAQDIQHTFGSEWRVFNKILKDHEREFHEYFDLIDINSLKEKRVCDLGCGIGRWAYFLADQVKDITVIDFSEAIFEARKNLSAHNNVLFFLGDLKALPFPDNCFDFGYCLGVLHHLPSSALREVRAISNICPDWLIYLYYALDNRPAHYRVLLRIVSVVRMCLSRIRSKRLRTLVTEWILWTVYMPSVYLGNILSKVIQPEFIPLFEGYQGKTVERIRQDVYDRFFTRIEQRVTREEITALRDTYSKVVISGQMPYWHFFCTK